MTQPKLKQTRANGLMQCVRGRWCFSEIRVVAGFSRTCCNTGDHEGCSVRRRTCHDELCQGIDVFGAGMTTQAVDGDTSGGQTRDTGVAEGAVTEREAKRRTLKVDGPRTETSCARKSIELYRGGADGKTILQRTGERFPRVDALFGQSLMRMCAGKDVSWMETES